MKDTWESNKFKSIAGLQENVDNELINQLNFNEYDDVLDAGCGVGNLTFKVAELVKKGTVLGIDSSPSMIEQCNKELKMQNAQHVHFMVKSISDINFTNQFNVVFSNSVFHWIKDPKKALDLLFCSLKPGGQIGIQFPLLNSRHPMMMLFTKVVSRLKLEEEFRDWEFPWYVPTVDAFKNLLKQYDFKETKVYKKASEYNYGKSSNLYNSFDSAALKILTSILPEEKKELFKAEIKKEVEIIKESNKHIINFDRIYAFGYNKRQK